MLRLYDFYDSGNGYKARLALAQLGIPYEYIEVDIEKGESRTREFLARNPNGRIPVLELESGAFLPESNAILCYLAEGTTLMPSDRHERAQVLQWLFFEQYNHEPNIATARYWLRHGHLTASREPLFAQKRLAGYAALGVMEGHLASRTFFVGEHYSIADIALYAYTHVGDQGGFELKRYPAVCAWLDRVRAQPGHVPLLKPQS
jgi:glutathione S-transferase